MHPQDADIHIAIRATPDGLGKIVIGATKMPPEALLFMLRKALETAQQNRGKPDEVIEQTTQQKLRSLLLN